MTAPAAPSGGRSPLRLGGLVLLAVGVVAALIGLATLIIGDGGGDDRAAAPPPATATPDPGATPPGGVPPTGTTPPGAGAPPGATTTPGDGTLPVPPGGATPTDGVTAPGAPGDGTGAGGSAGAGGAGSGGAAGSGSGAGSGGAAGAGSGGAAAGSGSGSTGGGGGGGAAVRAPLRVYNNSTITGLATDAAADFRAAGWPVEEVANYPFGIIPTTTVYYRPGTGEETAARALGDETGMRVEPRFSGLDNASPGLIVIVTNDYDKR